MILGKVNANREATLWLQVRGPAGQVQEIEAVIDTGFNGFLLLPSEVVAILGLVPLTHGRAVLANGREDVFAIYEVTVVWDGQPLIVEAGGLEATLVGMSLLYGKELRMHVVEGGHVSIAELP